MKKYSLFTLICLLLFISPACEDEDTPEAIRQFPRASISASENLEGADGSLQFLITLSWDYDLESTVYFSTEIRDGDNAEPDIDFVPVSFEEVTFQPGETEKYVSVDLVDDAIQETDETFSVVLSNPINAKILSGAAKGSIINDDDELIIIDEGYETPDNRPGFDLVWTDEFDQGIIDPLNWDYEIGDGCNRPPDCGWGNNELQYYTDRPTNSFIVQDYLVIEARRESFGTRDYTSARLISLDKQEFQYGRIDIRARMPKGRGLWPALWMLGSSWLEEGWPRCGEIDIMELIGQQPSIVYGTAHFESQDGLPASNGGNRFLTGGKDFSDEFNVFSIRWSENRIEWLLNDQVYHTLSPSDINSVDWPFNEPFFFILNVAVGGNWPGSPDENTAFPQRMIVDYVRVFQES